MPSPTPLPVAFRAFPANAKRDARRPFVDRYERPRLAFIFDTETTVDRSQALTFGAYRVYLRVERRPTASWRLIDEGLFYAEELHGADVATLRDYAREHWHDNGVELRLLPLPEFLELFYQYTVRARALVIGFNLPFDISRIAASWGLARGRRFAGGFSFVLWQYRDATTGRLKENKYRPRIAIKTIDSKRQLIGFQGGRAKAPDELIPEGARDGKPTKGYTFRGNFLDVRTLAFALTDRSLSLAGACEAFEVEHSKLEALEHGKVTATYVDYNRRDVLATWELTLKLLEEYDRHPVSPGYSRRGPRA